VKFARAVANRFADHPFFILLDGGNRCCDAARERAIYASSSEVGVFFSAL